MFKKKLARESRARTLRSHIYSHGREQKNIYIYIPKVMYKKDIYIAQEETYLDGYVGRCKWKEEMARG